MFSSCLQRDVLDCWFPRALDPTGGFRQNFDTAWQPTGDRDRGVVYQSRLTWTAAQVAKNDAWTKHGLAFLTERLWDREWGGFHWAVTPDGAPTGPEKHVYGVAFGLYAAASAGARGLAQQAFLWLEEFAHDTAHGGWIESLGRDGTPLPADGSRDAIGTVRGLKSMNTHIHVLEALTALYPLWPDPLVRTRLEEAHALVRDTVCHPDGYQHLFFTRDWTPVAAPFSFGHDVETGFLLIEAAEALGLHDNKTLTIARALVDHALAKGWDTEFGGLYDSPEHPQKVWWVQAEALNAFCLMDQRFGAETTRYADAFAAQWDFLQRFQLDHAHGGWWPEVQRDGTPYPNQRKSDSWTDPYHQARALHHVIEMRLPR